MSLDYGVQRLAGVASGREHEQLVSVLFEKTHDFAFLLEASGLVVRTNTNVCQFTDTPVDQIVGRRLWNTDWFHSASESGHQIREDLQRAVGGDRIDREYRMQGASRIATVDIAIQPVPANRGSIELIVVTGTKTRSSDRQRSDLEAEKESLEEFVRVLTHDVRGLLEVARGNLELAGETTTQSELTTVSDSLDRIEHLLDHCSETLREGKLIGERVRLDLGLVARDAWRHTDTTEASLSIDSSTTLRADRTRLMEVFENLFRNAVEHADQAVTVRVGTTEDGFYIADDGPGLPDETVFKRGVSTAEDGTGLGLPITETIVDAHGWSIQATESKDGGARFEICTTR